MIMIDNNILKSYIYHCFLLKSFSSYKLALLVHFSINNNLYGRHIYIYINKIEIILIILLINDNFLKKNISCLQGTLLSIVIDNFIKNGNYF